LRFWREYDGSFVWLVWLELRLFGRGGLGVVLGGRLGVGDGYSRGSFMAKFLDSRCFGDNGEEKEGESGSLVAFYILRSRRL
jgi:hypothetical protein